MTKSLGLAVLCLLVTHGATDVPALGAATTASAADTTDVTPPLRFRSTTLFSTRYLSRAVDAALEKTRAAEEPVAEARAAELAADDPEKRAAAYARRFGIGRELAQKILEVAAAEGVDPELGFRLVRVESGFKTRARGASGSLGLTQLMPSTARTIDRSMDSEKELFDANKNLRVGFRYLRQMIERYDGDVRLGLLAYNRGEVAVDRALKRGRDPENGYSHKVLGTRSKNPYRGKGLVKSAPKTRRNQSAR